jgi:hypothetical protein
MSQWPSKYRSFHIEETAHTCVEGIRSAPPFLLYSLRHTFATRIAPHVDVWTLCKTMGWASLSAAMRYIHPSDDRVLDAISHLGRHNSGHRKEIVEETKTTENHRTATAAEVSGAGFEPATHALKEYAAGRSGVSRGMNEMRFHAAFMRVHSLSCCAC